jgi:AcrR family transcriptional regulator
MVSETELHLRRLWRHRGATVPAPRRGPRGQLDLDEILESAIALADAEGLAAVSTRAVAARFGKTAMTLYPYVGTKDQLLALMQDHAWQLPSWSDPQTALADALEAWAMAMFDLHLAHPWLAERPWSETSQGPHERDWMERLLTILAAWSVPARPAAVTLLYATVRACAATAAAYRHIDRDGAAAWLERAETTTALIPDLAERYPHTAALPPTTTDWRDAPRAGLAEGVRLVAGALAGGGGGHAPV